MTRQTFLRNFRKYCKELNAKWFYLEPRKMDQSPIRCFLPNGKFSTQCPIGFVALNKLGKTAGELDPWSDAKALGLTQKDTAVIIASADTYNNCYEEPNLQTRKALERAAGLI